MLRTGQFVCPLPKSEADTLNAESGRIYTDMLVQHYRRYRKQEIWLSSKGGERMEDATGGPTTLHAHSRDAAQQGFYKACKTAKACRELGLEVNYPHKRKRFRTTIWKHTGIRKQAGTLALARARGPPRSRSPCPLISPICPSLLSCKRASSGTGRRVTTCGIWSSRMAEQQNRQEEWRSWLLIWVKFIRRL